MVIIFVDNLLSNILGDNDPKYNHSHFYVIIVMSIAKPHN